MVDKIGITEFRNIVAAIQKSYDMDFSNFALTSLKRRFEKVINIYNFADADELISRIESDKNFFEIFLEDISVEDTEMFRDPSFWKELKEVIIPSIPVDNDFKVWIPDCSSGEELYSLLIILKEMFLLDRVRVVVTSYSSRCLEKIKNGVADMKKSETDNANYRRFKGLFQLSNYFVTRDNRIHIDSALLNNVEFLKHDIYKDNPPHIFKIILYRNKLIYLNPHLQCEIINKLYSCLVTGGYFVIGVNEFFENCNLGKKFILINKTENIYKKTVI